MLTLLQCSLAHQLLPKDQQTKPEEVRDIAYILDQDIADRNQLKDSLYLTPIIKEIEAENQERDDLEAMVVKKRKARA